MQETSDPQEDQRVLTNNLAKQHSNIFKTISWILAYAVWIFIFLIPIIGIVRIVMFLLKNQPKSTTR
jgi:hypothetical protein